MAQELPPQKQAQHLHIRVNTFNSAGEQIGTRLVDLYHYGTKAWLQNHTWWAMHNGHMVKHQLEEMPSLDDVLTAEVIPLVGQQQAA